MRTLGAFVLELMAFLSLCLLLAILMGVPALWAALGFIVLLDAGVILFLSNRSGEPGDPTGLQDLNLHPLQAP